MIGLLIALSAVLLVLQSSFIMVAWGFRAVYQHYGKGGLFGAFLWFLVAMKYGKFRDALVWLGIIGFVLIPIALILRFRKWYKRWDGGPYEKIIRGTGSVHGE